MLALAAALFILGVINLNLVALALLGSRLTGHYPLSRAATPLAVALLLFFCEHFVGLGRLAWCWPLTTAASASIVWRERDLLRRHWRTEAAFLGAFAWVFAWRLSYPGVVPSSEKIGDLAMISSYLPGSRLPPQDAWLPPFAFDVYYSFQHYAAALLGRAFDLGPGLTYNLAVCFLLALTLLCAALCAHATCGSARRAALVVVAFAVGGTGATVPAHFMVEKPQLYSGMRFIGDVATWGQVETPFGRALLEAARVPRTPTTKLPSETFAYLTALGDYHPPLSGFYLLALALLCIALVETGRETRFSSALLAASIPLCAIANGWTLPLQALLVFAWLEYRLWHRLPVHWKGLAGGVLVSAVLCYPFLSRFASRTADYNLRLRLVPAGEHAPLLLGAIVLWPILAAIFLPLLSGESRRKPWILWASALWLVLLVVSETFYVDDIYSGPYNRFNTTLKWWPWIQAGALLVAGGYGMASRSRLARYATVAVLAVVSLFGIELGRDLILRPKPEFGRLDGAAWITNDPIEKPILEFLKAQPRGIVLQRLETGAFTAAPGLTLFAGQTAFMGWPEHEKLWRGQRADVAARAAAVERFYAGTLPNSAEWLLENDIGYVLWLKPEYKLPPGTFEAVDAQIRPAYYWREYYRANDFRVGLWTRRTAPVPAGAAPVAAPVPAVATPGPR